MTEDLVAFLRARLDEAAERAQGHVGDERHRQWALHESADYNESFIVYDALEHLRDIEVKRRLISLWGIPAFDERERARQEMALRLLALLDDEHPDYRQEWKP